MKRGGKTSAEYHDPEDDLFEAALLPGRIQRAVTPAAIASQGGLPVTEIAELIEAFGLPRPEPDDPVFTPEEARVFIELGELDDLWPADAFSQLLPLADPLILGIHRRWIEHELAQRAVRTAEMQAGPLGLPGAVQVTFLFCDLKDFTAYAERTGDQAAIRVVDRFFDVVAQERGRGRFVKSLGDGAMLVYGDSAEAVVAGDRIIRAVRGTGSPGVHASVHRGNAIARSGDYFGGSVNLAARLLGLAGRDELLATGEVVGACPRTVAWAPGDERKLRGVAAPVTVYSLISTDHEDVADPGRAAA